MQLTVKGKNFQVTDALKSYAEKRIDKIVRFMDTIISAEVTMSTERNWHIVEVTVYGNGFVLRGEERNNDMYTSIDKVLDKLEIQVKKEKGKHKSRAAKARKHVDEEFFQVESPRGEDSEVKEEHIIMEEPLVIRVPMINSKMMTIEEAIKEMEALDFSFFVFNNGQTDTINVIYRRKDGFGVIDPTYGG